MRQIYEISGIQVGIGSKGFVFSSFFQNDDTFK
jgi:hypothetical protein